MGRNSCCVKQKLRKGLWSPEEDEKLYNHITRFGVGCWSSVPKLAGLQRCGKSCRLRWINYLRPDLKRGMFSQEEEDLIISLHEALGNRWAQIAAQLPGRTDNEIKNFWNSCLKKKLMKQGIDPNTHKPITEKTEFKDCGDSSSLQPKGCPNLETSTQMEQQAYHLNSMLFNDGIQIQDSSSQSYLSKQVVYDPQFLSEFQQISDPNGYQSNFLSYSQQSQIESHISNPICRFNSMPDLTNFDHQNMMDADYSDCTASKMSVFLMKGAKDSSSNMVENPSTFSWQAENKLESLYPYQLSGIEVKEKKPSPWLDGHDQEQQQLQNQSPGDYSNFSLPALSQELNNVNLDVFQQYKL